MNNLSWLIYLAGVCDHAENSIPVICFFDGVFIVYIIYGVSKPGQGFDIDDAKKWWRRCAYVALAMFIINLVVPSRTTVILIAASEIGQQIVNQKQISGIVGDSAVLLTQWIHNETDRIAHEKSEPVKK
jgi:hypothetical protein